MSLSIGYAHPGTVPHEFTQSLLGLLMADHARGDDTRLLGGAGAQIAVQSGPRIAWARNEIVRTFLERTESDWLLMVDSDMVFRPDALDLLLEAAHPSRAPIVGGLCFGGGRSGIMFPTLYRLRRPDEEGDPVVLIEDYPTDALCRVDATGAAFLLMHRGALRRMEQRFEDTTYPWFIEGSVYKGVQFGEDWAFCMRAKVLGIPVYVHTGAKIGHVKSTILDETAWTAYRERKRAIGQAAIEDEHRRRLMVGPERPVRELEVV